MRIMNNPLREFTLSIRYTVPVIKLSSLNKGNKNDSIKIEAKMLGESTRSIMAGFSSVHRLLLRMPHSWTDYGKVRIFRQHITTNFSKDQHYHHHILFITMLNVGLVDEGR